MLTIGRFRSGGLLAAALVTIFAGVLVVVPVAGVASAQPPGWSNPTAVDDSSPVSLNAVSCTSTTFCVGVNTHNEASVYNGTTWTAQTTYETGSFPGAGSSPQIVSCASSTFCMAIDDAGNAFIYNGHTWSTAMNTGYDMSAISCVTATFCVGAGTAAAAGDVIFYNGTTWTPTSIDPGVVLDSISCPTAVVCMVMDNNGNAFMYNAPNWTSQGNVDSNPSTVHEVSCTVSPSTLCAAVDEFGYAFIYNGTWSSSGHIDAWALTSVSCENTTLCVAIDYPFGATAPASAYVYDGSSWSSDGIDANPAQLNSVSCPLVGSGFCVAVDDVGKYKTTSDGFSPMGPGPGGGTVGDSAPTAILAVSCATSAFCVSADPLGNTVTYSGDKWSSPTSTGDNNALNSVSCPTATFCAAVDDAGQVVTFDGSSWSAPDNIAGINMFSVSCASADLCVAIDNAGDALLYNGTTWTDNAEVDSNALLQVSCAPGTSFCEAIDSADNVITTTDGGTGPWTTSLSTSTGLSSVSCATASFCVVASEQSGVGVDYVTTTGGSSWSGPSTIDPTASAVVDSVSCPTSNVCVAVDSAGNAVLTNDGAGSWSSPVAIDTTVLESVSCASPTFCVVADNEGNAVLYTPPAPSGLYVSAVSPYTGLTTGNTAVTISGSGFTTYSVTGVFFGTDSATHVNVMSNFVITADSPPEAAGTVDVTVVTTAGTSAVNSTDEFTYTVATGPTTTSCNPSCSEAVSTPLAATTVSATGSSGEPTSAQLNLSVNAGTLPCPGTHQYTAAVSTLSTTGFAANATVTVTETVGDVPTTKGVKVCYAPLASSTGMFLTKCQSHVVAPCLKSLKELYGRAGAVATFVVRATDPRFWTGGGPLKVSSFTPAHGAPGTTVVIKGSNLTQAIGVSIGGASAHITKATAKALDVTVPASALTGLITATAESGSVTSPTRFTVT